MPGNADKFEFYVGWTCNHRCYFCSSRTQMEEEGTRQVTRAQAARTLLSFRLRGFKHVTFLGGEPLIQPVFPFAARLAKKLGLGTCISTNASVLQDAEACARLLKDIDDLVVSVPALGGPAQRALLGARPVDFDAVFRNVREHWRGNMLKANVVVLEHNLAELAGIAAKLPEWGVPEVVFTYPDLPNLERDPERLRHVPTYAQAAAAVVPAARAVLARGLRAHLADFPFCTIPRDLWPMTDDWSYANRIKLEPDGAQVDRADELPRWRKHFAACGKCSQKSRCWGGAGPLREMGRENELTAIPESQA